MDPEPRVQDTPKTMILSVDSDWGGSIPHRRSVTKFALKLAGGTIYYKSRYQDTVALSSTKAEFMTAIDTGKVILCVHTILQGIGLRQKDSTILHIDTNSALNISNQQ